MTLPFDTPIDRATLCAAKLCAIEQLLCQASSGCSDMHLVNPDSLALLLGGIVQDLGSALEELASQTLKAQLQNV